MSTAHNTRLNSFLKGLDSQPISPTRKKTLQKLARSVQEKLHHKEHVCLLFICTHNSRRSIFSQVWAQVIAQHFNLSQIQCYSGGTSTTSVFPLVIDTLKNQGLEFQKMSQGNNPLYAIKRDPHSAPIIAFSKSYNHFFNPSDQFIAVMTCGEADSSCPSVVGAELRIALTYEDPKVSDQSEEQDLVYRARSLQIASELWYMFSIIDN